MKWMSADANRGQLAALWAPIRANLQRSKLALRTKIRKSACGERERD